MVSLAPATARLGSTVTEQADLFAPVEASVQAEALNEVFFSDEVNRTVPFGDDCGPGELSVTDASARRPTRWPSREMTKFSLPPEVRGRGGGRAADGAPKGSRNDGDSDRGPAE